MELEKQAFLKSIPVFSTLTNSKLRGLAAVFKPLNKIRGGTLFTEGEPVSNLFLVKSGEFKLSKKIYTEAPSFDKNTELIFADPLRASKHNSKHHFKNQAPSVKH
jgi:signal-transduction protein with cAMP-binding, CBS, and nucleotidyltransferase domain